MQQWQILHGWEVNYNPILNLNLLDRVVLNRMMNYVIGLNMENYTPIFMIISKGTYAFS
jgi:hypothetical protein